MLILKVTKNQGFTLSLEDTFLEKPRRRIKIKLTPPIPHPAHLSRFRVKPVIEIEIM